MTKRGTKKRRKMQIGNLGLHKGSLEKVSKHGTQENIYKYIKSAYFFRLCLLYWFSVSCAFGFEYIIIEKHSI